MALLRRHLLNENNVNQDRYYAFENEPYHIPHHGLYDGVPILAAELPESARLASWIQFYIDELYHRDNTRIRGRLGIFSYEPEPDPTEYPRFLQTNWKRQLSVSQERISTGANLKPKDVFDSAEIETKLFLFHALEKYYDDVFFDYPETQSRPRFRADLDKIVRITQSKFLNEFYDDATTNGPIIREDMDFALGLGLPVVMKILLDTLVPNGEVFKLVLQPDRYPVSNALWMKHYLFHQAPGVMLLTYHKIG